MKKRENWSLGFWKCAAMSWKIAARRARKSKNLIARANAVRFWKEAMYMVKKFEVRVGIGVLVCLVLFIGGCRTGDAVGELFESGGKVITAIGTDGRKLNAGYMEQNRRGN